MTSHHYLSIRWFDNHNGTVTDRKTGLTWMRPAIGQNWNGLELEGQATNLSWDDAMALKTDFAGFDDWRLPTRIEADTLILRGPAPRIYVDAFPDTETLYFWTATIAHQAPFRFMLDYTQSGCRPRLATRTNAVRLVRGELAHAHLLSPFIDNGDGTATDPITNLRWMRARIGQELDGAPVAGEKSLFSWTEAQKFVRGFSFAGIDGWRLPNADELESIGNTSQTLLENGTAVFSESRGGIWTCAEHNEASAYALSEVGNYIFTTDKELELELRLVRPN